MPVLHSLNNVPQLNLNVVSFANTDFIFIDQASALGLLTRDKKPGYWYGISIGSCLSVCPVSNRNCYTYRQISSCLVGPSYRDGVTKFWE